MAGLGRHGCDGSAGFVEQEETSSMGFFEWTDEKHSLYLKSMEASFVNQLYNSKDSFSDRSSRELDLDLRLCRQSSKIKVQQNGQWKENRYGNGANQLKEVDKPSTIIRNRRIKRFRAQGMLEAVLDHGSIDQRSSRVLSSCRAARDGGQCQRSFNLNEEVSDQNFADEGESRAATGQRAKRLRAMDASTSANNDQVVPIVLPSAPTQDRSDGCSGSLGRMLSLVGHVKRSEKGNFGTCT